MTDRQTREKVLGKQSKEAAAKEQRLRQGTMNSDIQSDFDTESSSSQPTSSDFSELDQDLNDQDDDKKSAETAAGLTVEEQVQVIQRMKAKMLSLPVNMANIPEEMCGISPGMTGMKNPNSSHGVSSPSLPPEMMSLSAYTHTAHPFHSLPKGTHPTLTSNTSTSSMSDGASTLENERFSDTTLKEEETRFTTGGCGPATLSSNSTDGSTLTGGSFEGKFTSLQLMSGTSSMKNEDTTGTVASATSPSSLPTLQSSLASPKPHLTRLTGRGENPVASSPMETSRSDPERSSYYYNSYSMQSEQDSKLSMNSGNVASPSPTPPPFQRTMYQFPMDEVKQMCKTVDDVKERYHDELVRIKNKGQLIKQEAPDLSYEEQQRKLPVSY